MTVSKIEKVGFIGLGKMGAPIAQNILKVGFDLTVYDLVAEKINLLVAQGAQGVTSSEEAATGVDVVMSCLMDDQSVLEVVTEKNGLLAGLKPGGIHIGTTTISPGCAAKLAELHQAHGSVYVAGPIFGRPSSAETGTLLTYVAGDAEAIAACEKLFAAYTRSCTYVGADHKLVNSIKLSYGFILVGLLELFSEAYTLAEKSGIDLEMMGELILTMLAHPMMKEYNTRIRTRDFEPAGFALSTGFKDVELMQQASSEVRAPLPIVGIVREKFLTALANGMTDKDWSAIHEITRQNAGLP